MNDLSNHLGKLDDATLTRLAKAAQGDVLSWALYQWPQLVCKEAPGGILLDRFQQDMLQSVFNPSLSEYMIKGGTGVGKGAATAMAINLYYRAFADAKVIITSSSHDHALRVLFAEVVRWRNCMTDPGPGEIQFKSIVDKSKGEKMHYIDVVNPEQQESFRGHHSSHVMFAMDEATSIPDWAYKTSKTQAKMLLALGNPSAMTGWFRDAFPADAPDECRTVGRRRCVTASALECINVITGKELIQGQITRQMAEEIAAQGDWWNQVMIQGRFAKEDLLTQLFHREWLSRCADCWMSELPVDAFGLDIGASETGDSSVLAAGGRMGCRELCRVQIRDATKLYAWVLDTIKSRYGIHLMDGNHPIVVDYTGGYGRSVGDWLREAGCWVVEHIGGACADNKIEYVNKRTEVYATLSERLDPEGRWSSDPPWALPNDPMLFQELLEHRRVLTGRWPQWKVTPKTSAYNKAADGETNRRESVKDRIGRSPDSSDSVVYLWNAVQALMTRLGKFGIDRAGYVPDLVSEEGQLFEEMIVQMSHTWARM